MTYVCADLHGYPRLSFLRLLQKAGFSGEDSLFVLGDVIDRGPDGIRLMQWMMAHPNVQLIMGNHESMLLSCAPFFPLLFRTVTDEALSDAALLEDCLGKGMLELMEVWRRNGSSPTLEGLKRLSAEEREDLLDYVRDAPYFEAVECGGREFLLNHAGWGNYEPGKTQYTADEMLWNRPAITDCYYEKAITVFGHTPTAFYGEQYAGRMLRTDTWIDIDTSPKPMLLRLDDLTPIYPD